MIIILTKTCQKSVCAQVLDQYSNYILAFPLFKWNLLPWQDSGTLAKTQTAIFYAIEFNRELLMPVSLAEFHATSMFMVFPQLLFLSDPSVSLNSWGLRYRPCYIWETWKAGILSLRQFPMVPYSSFSLKQLYYLIEFSILELQPFDLV